MTTKGTDSLHTPPFDPFFREVCGQSGPIVSIVRQSLSQCHAFHTPIARWETAPSLSCRRVRHCLFLTIHGLSTAFFGLVTGLSTAFRCLRHERLDRSAYHGRKRRRQPAVSGHKGQGRTCRTSHCISFDLTLPFIALPLPFIALPLRFLDLSVAFPWPSTAFA